MALRNEQVPFERASSGREDPADTGIRRRRDPAMPVVRRFRLRYRYGLVAAAVMELERYTIYQRSYESFTDSCLSADMNPCGRVRLWAGRADHDHATTPR